MNNEKLYNVALTAQQVMLASAVFGNTDVVRAAKDIDSFKSYALASSSSGSDLLFNRTKAPTKGQSNLSDKVYDLYIKFYKELENVQEDFTPKMKKIYFCLYENSYGKPAHLSNIYEDKDLMLSVCKNANIIEIFEKEVTI